VDCLIYVDELFLLRHRQFASFFTKGRIMKKANVSLAGGILIATLVCASANVSAAELSRGEPMYNFLPGDTVVQNVKTSLQNNGIDASSLTVDADAKGVVQLSGLVGSKQDAEAAASAAKQADGVYAVLGSWRYETAAIPVSEANTMLENEPTAAGTEQPASSQSMQPEQTDAQ
jgi:hypothetical protein